MEIWMLDIRKKYIELFNLVFFCSVRSEKMNKSIKKTSAQVFSDKMTPKFEPKASRSTYKLLTLCLHLMAFAEAFSEFQNNNITNLICENWNVFAFLESKSKWENQKLFHKKANFLQCVVTSYCPWQWCSTFFWKRKILNLHLWNYIICIQYALRN